MRAKPCLQAIGESAAVRVIIKTLVGESEAEGRVDDSGAKIIRPQAKRLDSIIRLPGHQVVVGVVRVVDVVG